MEGELKNQPTDPNVENSPKKAYKFDPTKKYGWEPDSAFLMNGEEFGVALNALRGVLNSPEYRLFKLVEKAAEGLENSLGRAVEVGMAKEIEVTKK